MVSIGNAIFHLNYDICVSLVITLINNIFIYLTLLDILSIERLKEMIRSFIQCQIMVLGFFLVHGILHPQYIRTG